MGQPVMVDSMAIPRIVIFARLPVPGECKTRLIPEYGPEGATKIYRSLLLHTVEQALKSGLPVEIRTTGGCAAEFRKLLGDGPTFVPQGDGDLGAKLARVEHPALVVGSDCPGVIPNLFVAAATALAEREVVIGPASDGGYYLIGFNRDVAFLFDDMEWSTDRVFEETMARLAQAQVAPAVLPELADVDEPEDLADWPEFGP
ncbi:TIGR04282 family arsenosugar biosynthesis glycosyltransferase [Blastomonas marina]|nr:TIGR04282 family arsenosugar biosynthesis glycosyltransferase [Blastomonas marina]